MLRTQQFFLRSEEKVDLFQFKGLNFGPSLFWINLWLVVIFVVLACNWLNLDVF